MNNYKFRGKTADGKWAYGFYVQRTDKKEEYICVFEPNYPSFIKVRPETIGQWTGKTGMQNIELYSGDIIEYNGQDFPDAVGRRAVITYDQDLARFVAGLGKNGIGPNLWHECKKLGNIHDNPELLEDK